MAKLSNPGVPKVSPAVTEQVKLAGNINGGMHRHLKGFTNQHLGNGFKSAGMPDATPASPDAKY